MERSPATVTEPSALTTQPERWRGRRRWPLRSGSTDRRPAQNKRKACLSPTSIDFKKQIDSSNTRNAHYGQQRTNTSTNTQTVAETLMLDAPHDAGDDMAQVMVGCTVSVTLRVDKKQQRPLHRGRDRLRQKT